jgi:hypothetical protein
MKATGEPPAAELPDRPSPAGNEEENRPIPHAGRREALRFVEDLESVQPNDIIIGLNTVRILTRESGALHREYRFRRWSIDANGVPEIHDLNADVKDRLIARCELEDGAVGAKTGDERRSCHEDTSVDNAAGCGSAAVPAEPGAGGRVLRKRAIC